MGVQIQTIDRCNASCIMCPYSFSSHPGPANLMDEGLYTRILQDLGRSGTLRSVCLMLQNEPLLDRRLPWQVRQVKAILGEKTKAVTVTNGALLTPERIGELKESGIDYVAVSIDASREESFKTIRPGLEFSTVVENTRNLIEILGGRRVGVKFLPQRANEGEEEDFFRYWKSLGASVSLDTMTNRAGALDEFERMRISRPGITKRIGHRILNRLIPSCPLSFTSMSILWDGRVTMCCHDWEPRDAVGNLSSQTVDEVWNGEKMNHYRHLLWSGRAAESTICRDCSLSLKFWGQ
jgi:radical SAM protein with 4Fe4S-binding SPASM domain